MDKYNVLITGTSSYGVGEGLLKVVSNSKYKDMINIFGASNSPYCAHKDLALEYFELPSAHKDNYIPELNNLIKHKKIDIVIPGSEAEMELLSKNQELVDGDVWVNKNTIIDIFNSKVKSSYFFTQNKVSIPQQYDFVEDINVFPLIVKPDIGKSSEGITVVNDINSLVSVVKQFNNTSSAYLIQEYIESNIEYTVSVICINNICEILSMKRILNRGATQVCYIYGDERIEKEISKIVDSVKCLASDFIINIQLIEGKEKVYVLEVNPRFSGSSPMRDKLGFNEFDIIFSEKVLKKAHLYKLDRNSYCIRGYIEKKYSMGNLGENVLF